MTKDLNPIGSKIIDLLLTVADTGYIKIRAKMGFVLLGNFISVVLFVKLLK